MTKYLGLWRFNPTAPMPTDPVEQMPIVEMLWANTDYLIKTGEVQEVGWFLDGTSGYFIAEGDSTDAFRRSFSSYPFTITEVHEVVPHETAKEVMRGVMKAQAEAMAAMKR